MSTATIDMAQAMIRREQITSGRTKPEAVAVVARRAKVSPGQIEGAIRGRVKELKAGFAERIRLAFISETTSEINRLTHELHVAREVGLSPNDGAVIAAKAAMARLQAALEEG